MNLCVCVCVATMFWNPDRTVRSNRKNREPLTITVLLCSRTGLCQKCREPFEPRFNHTVLRTVIEPLLMVPLNLNLKKKKKKNPKQKKKKHNSLFRETKKHNSLSKEKKKVHHVCHCHLQRNTTCLYVSSSSLFRAHHTAPSLRNSCLGWSKL